MNRSQFGPSPAVIFKPVSEGAVLLDTESEVYFGLNQVGAKVWELLGSEAGHLDGICEKLCAIYPDVDPDQLRGDIVELLEQLAEHGLVTPTEGADAATAPAH